MSTRRFGDLLEDLIQKLISLRICATREEVHLKLQEYTGYGRSMIFQWVRGQRLPTQPATLEQIIGLGYKEAAMPRVWAEDLLKAANHGDSARVIGQWWGATQRRTIPCNLPTDENLQDRFVGRTEQVTKLLELLSPQKGANIIAVMGEGGIGKTTLVLQVAHRCRMISTGELIDPRVPKFERIIFVSAKQQRLTSNGLIEIPDAAATLRSIFVTMADVLDRPVLRTASRRTQRRLAQVELNDPQGHRPTLVIVDNLETIQASNDVMEFFSTLAWNVKVIVTTREVTHGVPVRVPLLNEEESVQVIRRLATDQQPHDQGRSLINDADARIIHRRVGGVPAALVYIIGQVASGVPLADILSRVQKNSSVIARFCFADSLRSLKGHTEAYNLLMARAIFADPPTAHALEQVAGIDPQELEGAIQRLVTRCLVQVQGNRFMMSPLTREFALRELEAHPEFEQEARNNWVAYYLNYAGQFGGQDWKDWYRRYEHLEVEWPNFSELFEWCAAMDRFNDMSQFWNDMGVSEFCSIRGHWDQRLHWLDWLQKAAKRHGLSRANRTIAAFALADAAWTYALMGQAEQMERARQLLDEADFLARDLNPLVQFTITHNQGMLAVRSGRLDEYPQRLLQQESALQRADLEPEQRERREIEMGYWRGIFLVERGSLQEALQIFARLRSRAETLGWERAVNYIQNHQATIALAEGRIDDAEYLLVEGLAAARDANDRRRIPYYCYSMARLEDSRGQHMNACRYATEAADRFERLGMQEADELHDLCSRWKCEAQSKTHRRRRSRRNQGIS